MKKVGFVVLAVLSALLFASNLCDAKWYPGIVHIHSTFSDGARTPQMLKIAAFGLGYKFMIVTDHLEQIPKKKKIGDLIGDDYGFAKYISQFLATKPILCLPGAELTSTESSHILAIAQADVISRVQMESDQQSIITKLDNMGVSPIAAHPNIKKYKFDQTKAQKLRGIEFFNEGSASYQKTLSWYLELTSQGENLFVTAGCDSHTADEPLDALRWLRQTMVWSDEELTLAGLYDAFSRCQTYAANNGAYFKSSSYLPQRSYQKVDRPKFVLDIAFARNVATSKPIHIYRDGKAVSEAAKIFPAGRKNYRYEWEDKDASSGKHAYIIEVEGCLVTSPIKLDVVENKPSQASPAATQRPTPQPATSSFFYRDQIDESIKSDLKKLWQKSKSRNLILKQEDLDYVKNYDADRRVVATLAKLSETHTLAVRMKIGYQNERCWVSRESSPSFGPNISAHFTAQAFDIFYADGVEIAWQVSNDSGKRLKARNKIRQLLKEILAIGRRDNNLLPTQMMIYSWDDVNVFATDLNRFYGPASGRGNSGMWANDRMWDRIHIGY